MWSRPCSPVGRCTGPGRRTANRHGISAHWRGRRAPSWSGVSRETSHLSAPTDQPPHIGLHPASRLPRWSRRWTPIAGVPDPVDARSSIRIGVGPTGAGSLGSGAVAQRRRRPGVSRETSHLPALTNTPHIGGRPGFKAAELVAAMIPGGELYQTRSSHGPPTRTGVGPMGRGTLRPGGMTPGRCTRQCGGDLYRAAATSPRPAHAGGPPRLRAHVVPQPPALRSYRAVVGDSPSSPTPAPRAERHSATATRTNSRDHLSIPSRRGTHVSRETWHPCVHTGV